MGPRVGIPSVGRRRRLRHNPLRRRSDVAEAWLGVATAVLITVGAPAAGVATAVVARDAVLRQSSDWQRVPAVLTEEAAAAPAVLSPGADDSRVHATVRWAAPDGTSRTGRALVPPGADIGSPTSVWIDERGVLRAEPVTPGDARSQGILLGTVAAAGTCLLALAGRHTVRVRLDRHRAAQWEREWAEIGPQWGRSHG